MSSKKRPEVQSKIKISDQIALREKYEINKAFYERLGKRLKDAIEEFLAAANVPYVDIFSRVKDFNSALGKIEKKQYTDPFLQIEDWCGLRIICYYPSDVDRICSILQKEFDIQTEEDTALRLQPHEFGYRSTHLILKIKDSWLEAPTYRGLGSFKAEVQVRTLLMHAWAEIEHKLAYKSTEQVPDQFKRKLYRLSAKFEEADEQFEELRVGLRQYRESLLNKAAANAHVLAGQDLNLDTLQAFLDTAFPNREKEISETSALLEEMNQVGLSMANLLDAYERTKPILEELERVQVGDPEIKLPYWIQAGAARAILDFANEDYYSSRIEDLNDVDEWLDGVKAAKKMFENYERTGTMK